MRQALPCMKVDCSVLCTPAIAASIRNPGCRPSYSYRLARPISVNSLMQAWLIPGCRPGLS